MLGLLYLAKQLCPLLQNMGLLLLYVSSLSKERSLISKPLSMFRLTSSCILILCSHGIYWNFNAVIRQTCRCNIMVKRYPVNSMEFMVIGIFSSNISMSSSMEKSHNCTKYGQISGIFRGGGFLLKLCSVTLNLSTLHTFLLSTSKFGPETGCL